MRFIKNGVFPKPLVIVHLSLTDRNEVRTNFKNIHIRKLSKVFYFYHGLEIFIMPL